MKRFFIILVAFIALLFIAVLLLRGYFLEQAILKVQNKVAEKYQANLAIGDAAFEGIARVRLSDVALSAPSGDTLFYCRKTAVSISLLRFIKGQPPIDNVVADSGFIRMIEYADSTNNYSFLLRSEKDKEDQTEDENVNVSFEKQVARLWNRFFGVADLNFSINDFLVRWQTPGYHEELIVSELTLNNSKFNFSATDSISGHHTDWEVHGVIDPDEEVILFEGKTGTESSEEIPFFKKITGIKIFINNFGLSVARDNEQDAGFGLKMHMGANSPAINHWRISPEDVVLDSLRARYTIVVKDNEISTGPESGVFINQLPFFTELKYEKNDSTVITVKINVAEIPAQDFFNSLPKGLFTTLEGIKVKGNLSYHLHFHANLSDPDNLIFDSELKKSEFRITGYGNENFSAINIPFSYTAREKDVDCGWGFSDHCQHSPYCAFFHLDRTGFCRSLFKF